MDRILASLFHRFGRFCHAIGWMEKGRSLGKLPRESSMTDNLTLVSVNLSGNAVAAVFGAWNRSDLSHSPHSAWLVIAKH